MNIVDRINAFSKLGDILRNPDAKLYRSFGKEIARLQELIASSVNYNVWFTAENVAEAVRNIGESLRAAKIEKWLSGYDMRKLEHHTPETVGVVMAGNIPLVGFHDFVSVLMSGHKLLAKLSSDDPYLLPLIARILSKTEPRFRENIEFSGDKLKNFHAVIATGSDNTARYFGYYFGKYPHIIRKNRNGIAVLTGTETREELRALGKDIFTYFGLGCRNVSKIYVPEGFDFEKLFDAFDDYAPVINHPKYFNNYEYRKSVFLVNKEPHLDNGFLLLKEDAGFSSPIAVLFFERYNDFGTLYNTIQLNQNRIQCVVSVDRRITNRILPGTTQTPELWDYADGVDTMDFLLGL